MYWPWKWFELYNNCTSSTWKDKFVFNLLFWIPNSVCGFRYYGGRHSLPCLSWRHVTDFLLFRILSNFHLPWKQSLSWNFSLYWNIFIFQDFWATCACPEKQSAWIHSIEYIHFFIQNFEQFALALKTEFALNFSLQIFFIIQGFSATCTCPENRVGPEFFKLGWRQPSRPPPRTPLGLGLWFSFRVYVSVSV